MTGPMWAVITVATGVLIAGLVVALGAARSGRMPWKSRSGSPRTLAHQWASQDIIPARPGRHARGVGRTGYVAVAVCCALSLLALGSAVTLILTKNERADRFAVQLSGQSTDDAPEGPTGPRIVSEDSAYCLAATELADGARLTLAACDGTPGQRWLPAADGTVRLQDRCMAATTGDRVELAACTAAPAQKFTLGTGWLAGKEAGKCVDVAGGKIAAGADIVLRECARATARHWWYLAS